MILSIEHQTVYTYDAPVNLGFQRLRLQPNDNALQKVQNWQIGIDGGKSELEYRDQFDNQTQLVKLMPQTEKTVISVQGTVETFDNSGVYGEDAIALPAWFFKSLTPSTTPGREIKKLAQKHANNDGSVGFLHALSNEIREHVDYQTGQTDATTTAEEAWQNGAGVCQDHAQIMIAAARALGYEARYVSGYLLMNETASQSASHAWCEVRVAGLGWVGFDVSNGYSPDERYVRLAVGRDYFEAAPIHGLRYGNAQETLDVHLQIQQ